MRKKENYNPLIAAALGLTLAIMATFQVYALQEPARLETKNKREHLILVTQGRSLYEENCVMCHGPEGEGVDGPALNDSNLLAKTSNDTMFSVISSGVPNTEMPAWNQQHGGPYTDQEIRQLVTFIREWEENAPDREEMAMMGDAVNGLVIFNDTCVICHASRVLEPISLLHSITLSVCLPWMMNGMLKRSVTVAQQKGCPPGEQCSPRFRLEILWPY